MASREKRPLAPSKSKQKANNDTSLPSNEIRNRKGKTLSNLKQQQLARDIIEAVATGSQLPPKLEATLPRKKVLRNLKRKQKLRVAKANLIKSKVTRKVTNRNLCRITSEIKKKGVKAKRIKLSETDSVRAIDINPRNPENHINNTDSESTAAETTSKSAKNNLRTKKTKLASKNSANQEVEGSDKDIDIAVGSASKNSPKLNRKAKIVDSPYSTTKGAKSSKFAGFRTNNIKDKKTYTKGSVIDIKSTKGRKSNNKEIDNTGSVKASGTDSKLAKTILDTKNSVDLTIDEVIASMLSDSELENQQGATEKVEGKITRSRKMLVEESLIPEIEIKKEPDTDEAKIGSDGEFAETEQFQNSIQLRKRSTASTNQRSLRNGKLRQLSDSGISTELDIKKRRRLNSDDPIASEASGDHVSDSNVDTESCFSESSGHESQTVTITAKEEHCSIKDDVIKNFEEGTQAGSEVENNNNSDRIDRTNEVGPTLRSKTKAKSTENEIKNEDIKVEYVRIASKTADVQDDVKKSSSLEQIKKENILGKFSDKSKSRRSSLNIDMRKTVNSFYGSEKTDSNSKSQIDQMIENIKLTIAKSIESKIFGPEKGLGLNKNFEVPKIEEIIAPLSAESQKLGLEENTDEEKPNVTKNEIKSESSDNTVPKVADTAKEIEKLVMGDIELTETHSQNVQESEPPTDGINNTVNLNEASQVTENNSSSGPLEEQEDNIETSNITDEGTEKQSEDSNDNAPKTPEDSKKATRKSPRISDKNSPDNTVSLDASKKINRVTNRTNSPKSEHKEGSELNDRKKSPALNESSNSESSKAETTASNSASDNIEDKSRNLTKEVKRKLIDDIHAENSNISKTEANINIPVSPDEAETLENISKEVEKLVANEQSTCIEREENTSQNEQESSNTEITSRESTDKETDTNEISVNTETAQCTNKEKNNSHISSNANCDSNSENDSTNSASPNASNSLEEIKKAGDDKIKDDKCKEVDTCNDVTTCSASSENEGSSKNDELNDSTTTDAESEKQLNEKVSDDQKAIDDKKRVLRTRDRSKKMEKGPTSSSRERIDNTLKVKVEDEGIPKTSNDNECPQNSEEKVGNVEELDDPENTAELDKNESLEPQGRTRRSRDVKRRKEDNVAALKTKRAKRDNRKSDQQNKEETLLDNEVAKINENNRAFLNKYGHGTGRTDTFRGFSEEGRRRLESSAKDGTDNIRSKSENDLITVTESNKTDCRERLNRDLSENHMSKQTENLDILDNDCKTVKTPETSPKDSDEASTSGESSSSVSNVIPKLFETPEDKAKKESILRLLGLESLEKAAERLSNQKARKEQYTGTLKTVIRVQKEKEKDKRLSRSPLKMVLKQGRGDGDGDSPEFYTIQKEFGTSGLGDSSSGANRKFSTNHRHSCDEDIEDAPPKDRQSLVIPEKSSSFSIHPGRLCADVCCYCFGKFGSLDTPMHLAQMKSDERRKKILNIERHLTKDSCLCDACYRHVDRKANTSPTNMQTKPQKQHRQLMVSKCSARDCRDPARHHVKRRWLLKIKAGLQNQVDIDWESSQHTSMSFCVSHYAKIERFLTCALCKRRLARNHTHQLATAETEELNQLLGQQGVPVLLAAGTFVCKLCKYFTQLQLKYKDVENMNTNHRSFFKSYRKRILHYHDIEVLENEDDDSSQNQSKDKEKRKKANKCPPPKNGTSKSPDVVMNSASEKSTPEPSKNEGTNSETDNENNRPTKGTLNDVNAVTDVQYLGIESTVEKLKKRKMLDMHPMDATSISCGGSSEMVEILAMDKEVTLTRLPKRPKTTNDINPVVQRLGANPSISVRTLFPGEEEMNLHANIEFTNVREITPQGWEKCATMIQYDRDTKLLWQELQRPYGNQSSFLRHLILLEKYYRSGDLVLAPNASRNAINYSTSVQNRLISYEGPEKMDEPIMEPITAEYSNHRRLSGGYMVERDRLSLPSTSSKPPSNISQTSKGSPPRVLKLNPGVSIIKKPPPNLQRLTLPSTSATNGNVKRKDNHKLTISAAGGKVFQLSEPDFRRLQTLKKQKQMLNDKQPISPNSGSSNSPPTFKSTTQYQKAQLAAHTQFQKHLRMQQEMLNRQSRSDFEPLICDVRSLSNENTPTQNLLHNLNLPKSIQVTTKPSHPIPILPKIPKSLTVIPQTVTRPAEK